jgi:hypothetical protein
MNVVRLTGKVPLDVLADLADMMMQLKHETEPDKASDDERAYITYIRHKLRTAFVYYYPKTGFCIIDRAFDSLVSCSHSHFFVMSHIYIVPEKRKGRAYAELFRTSIKDHDGQMIGLAFKNSDHNAVMSKRYKVLGTIYGRN